LTFKRDLNNAKVNQQSEYLGQRSCSSKIICPDTHTTHTHPTDCSTWTTKVVGNNVHTNCYN